MPRFTTTDKVGIWYEAAGEGFPLVLLHPWPTDHAMWMLQVPKFSERYRVITPDSRGLGRSDRPASGYSLKRLADDVSELMDHLGVEKAFVVGNSLGGAVAEKFALEHAQRVQATVWIGAPTFPLDTMEYEDKTGSASFVDIYLDALRAGGYTRFWEKIWKPTMSFQFHENFVKTYVGSYLIRYLFEERYVRLNSDPKGAISILEGIRYEKSLDGELARLETPSAIVAGDGDDTLPACRQQHEAIPRAEFLVIKDSGHFCYMDQAEVFNRFLEGFLADHAP